MKTRQSGSKSVETRSVSIFGRGQAWDAYGAVTEEGIGILGLTKVDKGLILGLVMAAKAVLYRYRWKDSLFGQLLKNVGYRTLFSRGYVKIFFLNSVSLLLQ